MRLPPRRRSYDERRTLVQITMRWLEAEARLQKSVPLDAVETLRDEVLRRARPARHLRPPLRRGGGKDGEDAMTTPLDSAAIESDLEDFDRLKDLILTLLPYALDDGEDPPNEANAEECVEYAADEIKRLRASARPEMRTFTTNIIVATDSGATRAATYNPPVVKEPTLYTRQQAEAMLRVALTDRTDEWMLKTVDERVAALLSMFTLPTTTTKEKP